MSYANRNRRPPRSLTDDETRRLLHLTGLHRDGFRDHVILSIALGTGLRESEIVALDVGDVLTAAGGVRRAIQLRVFKGSRRDGADAGAQRVHLPEATFYKLDKFVRVEQLRLRPPASPLFESKKGGRLSTKAVRTMFRTWQARATFDHPYPFHALRHTAITLVRRRTGDVRLTQRFARHANINTTMIYEHAADEELAAAVRGLPV